LFILTIPLGIYLSQLYALSRLPDLIDPTAPNEAVTIDPVTANFDAPAHPEVFSTLAPLPLSMHLEPLINVHKQRMIAEVIKSLVAGQQLASRVQFHVDKRLFQQCLRLRGLDSETLQRVLAMHQDH
jgi:Gdp/GTP exchange factor required for growth at low temperatures